MTVNFSQTAAYIWSLADLLRGSHPAGRRRFARRRPHDRWYCRGQVRRWPGSDLLELTGPLASSSANLAGDLPATTLTDATTRFPALPIWANAPDTESAAASAVVDCTGEEPVVGKRAGPLPLPAAGA